MSKVRYVIISILVFAVHLTIQYYEHMRFMRSSYAARPELMRVEGIDIIVMNVAGSLIYSFLFCYIFVKGYEGRGVMEGVRFGVVIIAFLWFPKMIFEYANMNFPGSWPLFWFLFGAVSSVICGVICAFIYRAPKKKGPESETESEEFE